MHTIFPAVAGINGPTDAQALRMFRCEKNGKLVKLASVRKLFPKSKPETPPHMDYTRPELQAGAPGSDERIAMLAKFYAAEVEQNGPHAPNGGKARQDGISPFVIPGIDD
jgi:hypothetical protein